jgi:hypothetical protein
MNPFFTELQHTIQLYPALIGLFPICSLLLTLSYLYLSYPSYLEFQIRQGKTWLYIPIFWSKWKTWIKLMNFSLRLGNILLLSIAMILPWSHLNLPYPQSLHLVASICLAFSFDLLLRKILLPVRYHQQLDLYFSALEKQMNDSEAKGERIQEIEAKGLISWSHQNRLRIADANGTFLQVLKNRELQPSSQRESL